MENTRLDEVVFETTAAQHVPFLWVRESDHVVVYQSDELTRLLGEDYTGQLIHAEVPGDVRALHDGHVSSVLAEPVPASRPMRGVRAVSVSGEIDVRVMLKTHCRVHRFPGERFTIATVVPNDDDGR